MTIARGWFWFRLSEVTDVLILTSDYGSLKYTKEILVQDSESCFRRDLSRLV